MVQISAKILLVLRLMMGWVFLFAGIDKIFGAEPFSAAGYLQFATAGTAIGAAEGAIVNPTHDIWVSMAANPAMMDFVNFIVPYGQVAIGLALIFGLFTRFAAVMGALMMSLFFVSSWDFAHGVINSHAVYAILTLSLGLLGAGRVYGLDAYLEKFSLVKRIPALRLAMG